MRHTDLLTLLTLTWRVHATVGCQQGNVRHHVSHADLTNDRDFCLFVYYIFGVFFVFFMFFLFGLFFSPLSKLYFIISSIHAKYFINNIAFSSRHCHDTLDDQIRDIWYISQLIRPQQLLTAPHSLRDQVAGGREKGGWWVGEKRGKRERGDGCRGRGV